MTQILNLTNVEDSDIKYTISRFPNGETQITLGKLNHKDSVNIKCRITNAEDLFILMQVSDILVRHGIRFNIFIYYLMGMQMDRVIDFNCPFTLKIIINILDNLGACKIDIFDPYSNTCFDLFKNTPVFRFYPENWVYFILKLITSDYQIMLLNADVTRYHYYGDRALIGEKVRDSTGKIISIDILNPKILNGKRILLVDTLCDESETFCSFAKAIREINKDIKIDVVIDHIVNLKDIENLSKTFNKVYFSNSYKDWNGFKSKYGKAVPILPENVTQITIV